MKCRGRWHCEIYIAVSGLKLVCSSSTKSPIKVDTPEPVVRFKLALSGTVTLKSTEPCWLSCTFAVMVLPFWLMLC